MKKILISSLILGATTLALGADNYMISNSWGGSTSAHKWSEGYSTFTEDTAIFDYQYYLENNIDNATASSSWGVSYYLYNQANLIPYLSPKNLVIKNLITMMAKKT